jgi:predicted transcriptional regulator
MEVVMLQIVATKLLVIQSEIPHLVIERMPNEAPVAGFVGANFVLALLAGVVMALGFQLLLTNLAIAVITAPGSDSSEEEPESLGSTIRGIETRVGFGLLVSVSIALFAASFLAVKLSLVTDSLLGAVTGVVIWSIFFTLLTWLGSNTLGSLLGSVITTATSGVQGLLGTATAAIGANVAKNQAVSTAEDITAAVRRELTAGIDPSSIQRTIQSSLSNVKLPQLNLDEVQGQFEKILKGVDWSAIADSDALKNVNRDTLAELVSSRTDFSKQDVERLTDQLETAWNRVSGQGRQPDLQGELVNLIKSANPEDLNSEELGGKLQQIVKSSVLPATGGKDLAGQALRLGATALLGKVLQNADLSDLEVGKVSGQLQVLKDKVLSSLNESGNGHANGGSNGQVNGAKKASPKPFSVIQADLENYLLFSPLWELNRDLVKQEFQEVIYDAAADPKLLRQEIELLNYNYFADVLSLRNDFTPEGVKELAQYLEEIRAEVFGRVQSAELQGRSQDVRSRVENYLRSIDKSELNPDAIEQEFKMLLEDPEAGLDALGDRLGQFDRNTLEQLLNQRQDVGAEESGEILNRLESTRDRVLTEARELQERLQNEASELRQRVSDYLRNTSKDELNPEGIERDLKTLLDDPQAGVSAIKSRLSQFDRDTLVQLLSQRDDLSEEQVEQVLGKIESVRDNLLQAPRKLADKAREQYEQTTRSLSQYLRETNLEELNPEGIQRDLQTLLDDPKAGATAFRERLSQFDRETLTKLLSQRGDLSEEQINQTLDRLESAIQSLIKAPRRLANRVQRQAVDFESNLERYLRNTRKEELNPEGIKRDLQVLLQHPQAGLSQLGDRVSQFDRETFVSLLSQREDISEEEANRIADQAQSAYSSIVERYQQVQKAIQSTLDKGFSNIRNYLNSLERSELNYDGIKQDFAKLFDDPQLGLEALGDRLSQFDRGTLVALLSSREDISEADANRIIEQVELARDSVAHRIERIQQETQRRLHAIQHQTKQQVRETRKVASGAAWWVFSTALTSLAAAAIAGVLAVGGLEAF